MVILPRGVFKSEEVQGQPFNAKSELMIEYGKIDGQKCYHEKS